MTATGPLSLAGLKWLGLLMLAGALVGIKGCGSSGDGIDPGVVEIPLAYINRPIPLDDMGDQVNADLREPLLFSAGGDVYLQTTSQAGSDVTNITAAVTGGQGDVKGLNSDFEGKKLIFSLRLFDPDPNDDDVPSWNIYEYELETATLRRIITDDITAEAGDDLYPAYLPDGRIVFTSSRQTQAREILTNELKPQFSALDEDEDEIALVLHVMNPDGSALRQISFNQSHDLQPQVLGSSFNGQVVFSRWDNAAGNNEFNIYKVNPDGSDLEMLYGSRSHNYKGVNVQFTGLREMPNGNMLAIAKPFTGTFDGGDIVIIDTARFVENDKPIWSLTGLSGPAQRAATVTDVALNGDFPLQGRYSSAFPLQDGSDRLLVSKSTCQLDVNGTIRPCIEPYVDDPNAQESSPYYSIWLYNLSQNTEKPLVLVQPGRVITEAITMLPIARQNVIRDRAATGVLNGAWITENVGVVNVRSVYDFGDNSFSGGFLNVPVTAPGITAVEQLADPVNATAAQRAARFVRFVKPVAIPDPDDPEVPTALDLDDDAFGPIRNRGMREIVGYAPIEPDGSIKVKVPANTPLGIEVLDGEGRRIGPPHNNWLQVQPGDQLNCVGCHDLVNGGAPPEVHSRADGHAPTINSGLPLALQFVNTLIPGNMSPNPYWGDFGQTMAEVRFDRVSLTLPLPTPQPQLNIDLVYDDYWTDPAARAPDASYAYEYANLDVSVPAPANAFCFPWRFNCRATINYPEQIHPIWAVDRGVDADMNGVGDDTCTQCHTTQDAMGNDRVADGQLDLTDGVSDQNNDHLKSYRELLFVDQEEVLNVTTLEDRLVPDGMGGTTTVDVQPSMEPDGARSSYFIEKLTETELDAPRTLSTPGSDPNYVDHTGFLTPDELKLIGEWLDLGAQNYNDPFNTSAPQN
ncbi:MAG: hypothetical protein QNJ85_02085 [Gammaproteobacteria bacterium]|nr:hypothetical protein [Gammaproteobacteria bacterium]